MNTEGATHVRFGDRALDTDTYLALARDLRSAMESSAKSDTALLLSRCAITAGKETVTSKVQAVGGFVEAAPGMLAGARRAVESTGRWLQEKYEERPPSASDVASRALQLLGEAGARTSDWIGALRYTTPEDLVEFIMTWVVAFGAAGGADLEGGLPDTDLLFGVDDHRNLFSHTILLGLSVETAMRFAYLVMQELVARMPSERAAVWAKPLGYAKAARSGSIVGMWLGIGAHFVKDTGLIAGGFKPYVGIEGQTMQFHQLLMTANGIAAIAVGSMSARLPSAVGPDEMDAVLASERRYQLEQEQVLDWQAMREDVATTTHALRDSTVQSDIASLAKVQRLDELRQKAADLDSERDSWVERARTYRGSLALPASTHGALADEEKRRTESQLAEAERLIAKLESDRSELEELLAIADQEARRELDNVKQLADRLVEAERSQGDAEARVESLERQLDRTVENRRRQLQELWNAHFRRLEIAPQVAKWVAKLHFADRLRVEAALCELNDASDPNELSRSKMRSLGGLQHSGFNLSDGTPVRLFYESRSSAVWVDRIENRRSLGRLERAFGG